MRKIINCAKNDARLYYNFKKIHFSNIQLWTNKCKFHFFEYMLNTFVFLNTILSQNKLKHKVKKTLNLHQANS